jgi:hypothetical protein
LDELEFASDSAATQTQQDQQQEEQRQAQEDPHLEPILTSINHSPPPLLLPSSTLTYLLPPVQSVLRQEEEEENHLFVPSILAAPLSPAMPLNSTYIAHRSIPIITQIPSTLLGLSTLIAPNTTINHDDTSLNSTSFIGQVSNLEQKISHNSPLLAPIESVSNRQDQETSMTQPAVQATRCSVSTQTNDDYYPTHHHCNDVSVCPCVQIYTRSEQLFMTSMAIFFRNSISITPPEPSLTVMNNITRKTNKRHQHVITPQSTPIINEIEIPVPMETNVEKSVR